MVINLDTYLARVCFIVFLLKPFCSREQWKFGAFQSF